MQVCVNLVSSCVQLCCNVLTILIFFKLIDIGMIDKTLTVVAIEHHSCMIAHTTRSSTLI